MRVTTIGSRLSSVPLMHLYQTALNNLRWMVITGQRAVAPQKYERRYEFPNRNGDVIMNWSNLCGGRYGTYEELVTIIKALETVTTEPGIMSPGYQNSSCTYNVWRDMGPGAVMLLVGDGLVDGTPVGNEVE